MGLAIHYSAGLRDPALLPGLIEEIADICRSMEWEYGLFDDAVEAPEHIELPEIFTEGPRRVHLKGAYFTPPECETVWLLFTPSHRLTALINWMAVDAYSDPELAYTVSVKTQFAGIDLHIALVHLLRYLEKKYLRDMEVMDEGLYWETLDRNVLEKQFEKYEMAFRSVEAALAGKEPPTGDPKLREFSVKLVEMIRKLLGE